LEEENREHMSSPGFYISLVVVCALGPLAYGQSPTEASTQPSRGNAVAVVGGAVITEQDVDSAAGRELHVLQEKIYALQKKALDDLIDRALLEQEAAARGITVEELKRRLVDGKVVVSDADVEREYKDHGSVVALTHDTHGVDDTKAAIRADLERKAKAEQFKTALAELRKKAQIEYLAGAPTPPLVSVTDSGPSRGAKEAPVTVIEFSDFQCQFCRQSWPTIDQMVKTYAGKIRLVFKQLPLPLHPQALQAAQASLCADAQGKFWPYHDKLFNSDDLTDSALKSYAAELGLNRTDFEKCLGSSAVLDQIHKDTEEARKIDVRVTPTFVINGKVLEGLIEPADFDREINFQLRKSGAPTR
jgi:protein-disulfide isomerase